MLATLLKQGGFSDFVIVEKNLHVGMKVKISGGGKCNVTNEVVSEDNYLGNSDFVSSILKQFTQNDLLTFLKSRGAVPKIRSLGQYFFKKSSVELLTAFEQNLNKENFLLSNKVLEVKKEESFIISTDKTKIKAKKLVIATGSSAYPQVGGSDIGLILAKSLGHEIENFTPVLVGWTVQKDQFWMKELSGISTRVSIDVGHKKLFGEMLFAHKGISGPAVLSASLYWKKGFVHVDFFPDKKIKDIFTDKKKQLSTQMNLSKRLSKQLLQAINLEDKPFSKLQNDELQKLNLLKRYPMSPAGNFGLKKAEACRGGVKTESINPETMESKICKDLYFLGEVLDVTGELGGYNFQWAFSSSYVCSKALIK